MEVVLRVPVVGALGAIVIALFAPIALADTLCDNRVRPVLL